MTQKLYEITSNIKELKELAEADPEMEIAVADTLEAIEMEFEDKALAVGRMCLNLTADVEAVKAEIVRLQARKKVVENRRASLIDYLRMNMERSGITKILKDPVVPIRYSKGRERVIIDDQDLIPDEFVRVPEVTVEADKKAIMDTYRKDGIVVEGTHIERGPASIKVG